MFYECAYIYIYIYILIITQCRNMYIIIYPLPKIMNYKLRQNKGESKKRVNKVTIPQTCTSPDSSEQLTTTGLAVLSRFSTMINDNQPKPTVLFL